MNYFKSAHGTVTWDEGMKRVTITWDGFSYGEEFQLILLKGAELLKLKNSDKVLMDTRHGSAIKELDKIWMSEFFVQHVYNSGLRYLALVEPGSVIAKMSINRTVNGLGTLPYQQQSFTGLEEASRWLEGINEASVLAVS
ncbi:hypothetical protein C2I18_07280 [Paenibacillus sp. PK3_47]|uniref:hypothetical protein n=1 Tax=Paenibacillus sp. PK3_47 TaxID=2072642 RepID=UPI00201E5C96|nr:hypothetical protein [Paenibacillus sp. PK3_47]UQZ33379.1 hypothetical protein C2I18_07280 [Paenibacillus sp. PK3_47]